MGHLQLDQISQQRPQICCLTENMPFHSHNQNHQNWHWHSDSDSGFSMPRNQFCASLAPQIVL